MEQREPSPTPLSPEALATGLPADPEAGWVDRLMHRWFVQYNPLALLSAALVLGGMWLLEKEAAAQSSALGQLSVAGLSELYALALIGGAAFLVRIGSLRSAVMLALLAVLYQGDLTLHVETCAYLGWAGSVASVAWLFLFALKLKALERALRLRLSCSAFLVPLLGGLGMVLLPQLFRVLDPEGRTALLAFWVFGLGAAGLWTRREVESAHGYDDRGRRAIRATWLLWAGLFLAHALYWAGEHRMQPGLLAPALLLLLGARWIRAERGLWALVLGLGLLTAFVAPAHLWEVCLMGAASLLLRALLPREGRAAASAAERANERSGQPYRSAASPEEGGGSLSPILPELAPLAPEARQRLLLGALAGLYLGLWTAGYRGGPSLSHLWPLDLFLLGAGLALLPYTRGPWALLPSALSALHLSVALRLVRAPRGGLEWGLSVVALGFGSLLLSLFLSWRHRGRGAAGLRGESAARRPA